MEDLNIGAKPYKVGDKLIIEVTVTDEDKSFDFLGKAITNKINTSDLGFEVDLVSFCKEKFVDNIPLQLRSEIADKLQGAINDIRDLLKIY